MILDNNLFFETGILHEDVRWSPEVLYNAKSVYTSNLCFYHYVLRANSISQKKDRKKNGRDLLLTCSYLDEISNSFMNNDLRILFLNYVAMTYMKSVAVNDMVYDKTVQIDKSFPIKRVTSIKDFIKSLIFFVSPRLYSKIYLFIKVKIKRDTL